MDTLVLAHGAVWLVLGGNGLVIQVNDEKINGLSISEIVDDPTRFEGNVVEMLNHTDRADFLVPYSEDKRAATARAAAGD